MHPTRHVGRSHSTLTATPTPVPPRSRPTVGRWSWLTNASPAVLDVESWTLQVILEGHVGRITAVAIEPQGRLVASQTGDGTAWVEVLRMKPPRRTQVCRVSCESCRQSGSGFGSVAPWCRTVSSTQTEHYRPASPVLAHEKAGRTLSDAGSNHNVRLCEPVVVGMGPITCPGLQKLLLYRFPSEPNHRTAQRKVCLRGYSLLGNGSPDSSTGTGP